MVRFGNIICVVCLFIIFSVNLHAEKYFINAYDTNFDSESKQVKTKIIDLENKIVTKEILLSDGGYITNKNPVALNRGNSSYLVSIVLQGCYCKNSIPGEYKSIVSIINPNSEEMIFSFQDTNLIVFDIARNDDNSIFLDGEIKHPNSQSIRGDYEFRNNWRFRLKNQRPNWYHPRKFRHLGRFTFYEPIDTLKQLYKAASSAERYLLKSDRNSILDLVQQNNEPDRSIVFASKDSLLYVFHQNFEFYGELVQKPRDEGRIESHALIYNAYDFSLIDSISIPDYPEGEYIFDDFGVADVVGDYIVHYFFHKGGLEGFEPAMLFIFDTRTNEATWLRVGWR